MIIRHEGTRVKFDNALSIGEAIQAMRFKWVHPDILRLIAKEAGEETSLNFMVEEVTEMEIIPISFKEPVPAETVFKALREHKLREQRIRQLFALVNQRPEFRKKWSLAALGTVFAYKDYRAFPCLPRGENELSLIPEDRIGTEIAPVFIASAI